MVLYAQPASQPRVPHGHASRLSYAIIRTVKTIQRCQLKQHAWPNPQLLRRYLHPSRPLTLSAATARPVAHFEAVTAEFSKAGIPDEVIAKLVRIYPTYLRWPIEPKLQPTLQLWLKHLGSQELSRCLDKCPRLLLRTPQESDNVFLWMASIGINAERMQQKVPRVMATKLSEVQSTVQVVAELLAVPVASEEMQEVIMVGSQRLFNRDAAVVHHRVSFFCKEFKGGQHAAKAALKQGVFSISVETMRARAVELKAMLSWTTDELNQALCVQPRILTHQPSTVATNIQKLQAHNFTSAQALDIYASYPSLAGYDWNSPLNVEKLEYLTLILQLSRAELASRPQLLGASLAQKIGPRSEFVYRFRGSTPDTPLGRLGGSSYITAWPDARFAVRFNILSANPPLTYNEDFKQQWWQRWTFLRHDMGLSVVNIFACRALLFMSLHNTLAPRWRFLTQLEAAQADFRAADNLIALATLSDQLFAEMFNILEEGLKYDKNSM